MLSLLQNNFVISGLVSLILTAFIVSQDRNKEEKHGVLFYLRCFALNFILILVVLYFKTGDLSLPFANQSGGSLPLNPISSTVSGTSNVSGISNLSTSLKGGYNSTDPGTVLGLQKVDLGVENVNLGKTPF